MYSFNFSRCIRFYWVGKEWELQVEIYVGPEYLMPAEDNWPLLGGQISATQKALRSGVT